MKKRLITLILLCLLGAGLVPTLNVKAADSTYVTREEKIPKTDKIYYVETDDDEFIALQRVLANHVEHFTIRYLASKEDDLEFLGLDSIYYVCEEDSEYKHELYESDGCSEWMNSYWNDYYVTARGQKWLNIDYEYVYYEDAIKMDKLRDDVRKTIVESGVTNKTDYEKLAWVYDWMCSHIVYDHTFKRYKAYEAFEGSSVCEGYARLFEVFTDELDLNTRYVIGDAYGIGSDGEGWGLHAWNIAYLDGEWYQIDTTWGVRNGRDYFLRGEEYFKKTKHKLHLERLDQDIVDNISDTDYTGTGDDQFSTVPARTFGIIFDPVYRERLNIGEEYQWLIKNDTGIELTYENSNPDVASLSDDGKVVALKEGKTTLTATNKELNMEEPIDIIVSKELASLSDITTVKSAKDINVVYGKTAQVKIKQKDSEGILQGVKYESQDNSIATVDDTGKVTGVKAGKTSIHITCDNGSDVNVKVTVKPLVNTKTATVKAGSKISLRNAIVISEGGPKDLVFTCKDNMSPSTISINGTTKKPQVIATVSKSGYVTGKSKGTVLVDIYNKDTNKLLTTVKVK